MRHTSRHFLASAVLALIFLPACAPVIEVTPPGRSALLAPVVPATPPTTAADGWSGPEAVMPENLSYDMSPGISELRAAISRGGRLRAVVYFNERLSERISSWQTNQRGVLEATISGSTNASGRMRVYTEYRNDAVEGRAMMNSWLGEYLEQLVSSAMLEANVTLVDKGLLTRRAAASSGIDELNQAELLALTGDADVVLEVTFKANPMVAEGYDVVVRALRTRDAAVLARASTAGHHRGSSSQAQYVAREGGFERVTTQSQSTLEYLTGYAMTSAMQQIAQRYW